MDNSRERSFSLPGGPLTTRLAEKLRGRIESGQLTAGQFLPSVRKLSSENHLAHKTVFQALKKLEAQGWIVAEAGRGYRVLARVHDPYRGAPVAFVLTPQSGKRVAWTGLREMLLSSFQRAVSEHGWMLLCLDCNLLGGGKIVEQLRNMKICGVILDTLDPALVAAVRQAGIPLVVLETWPESIAADSVVQDAFRGGYMAAAWLAERGHKRIGWIAPSDLSWQGQERCWGARAALARHGLELPSERCLALPDPEVPGRLEMVREFLARQDRPTGVLALWQGIAALVAKSGRSLKLPFGQGFDMVGWSTEDAFDSEYKSGFTGESTPPAVVWDANALAKAAVARLAERRGDPHSPPLELRIPTRLRFDVCGEWSGVSENGRISWGV